jgi:hypothetical protein
VARPLQPGRPPGWASAAPLLGPPDEKGGREVIPVPAKKKKAAKKGKKK